MKILFFVGELCKRLNASNKIIMQIAGQLSVGDTYGCVFGINDEEDIDQTIGQNISLIAKKRRKNPFAHLEEFVSLNGGDRKSAAKQFIKKHPITAIKIAYGYRNLDYISRCIASEDINIIKEFLLNNSFDVIISIQSPLDILSLFDETKTIKIIYQLDPLGLHELNGEKEKQLIDVELKYFEKADHIFTTSALYNQYKCRQDYSKYIDKLSVAEFPNVREIENCEQQAILFDEDYINIVYCGIMEDYYRSPERFLLFFEKVLNQDNRIRIYFVGDIISDKLNEFERMHPDNIKVLKPVELETAIAIQQDADVLLSIGNMLKNQLPSKLFDYFSMGKALIATLKFDDSPEKLYIDKYPLGYSLNEFSENSVDEFIKFVHQAKGEKVEFDIVKKLFYNCTPEYVAEQFRGVLSDATKRS